jgi:hypothetical protein
MPSTKTSCCYFIDEFCILNLLLPTQVLSTDFRIKDICCVINVFQSRVLSFSETLHKRLVILLCQKASWEALVKWSLRSLKRCEIVLILALSDSGGQIHLTDGCISSRSFARTSETYRHLKWEVLDVGLSSSLHYLQDVPKDFWISEVCSNDIRLNPS